MTEQMVTFSDAVNECWRTEELMVEYRRLSGSTLGLDRRSGIDKLIDEASGHNPWDSEYVPFFEFVRDVVWMPLAAASASARTESASS